MTFTCFHVGRRRRIALWTALCLASASNGCKEELPPKPQPHSAVSLPTASTTTGPSSTQASTRRVLLVHSYHPEYPWANTISQGIRSVFVSTNIELDVFYMDTKRHTDEAWKITAGDRARKEADTRRPDLVLAVDDDAQQYFAKSYGGQSLPVVFCGVDADPTKYGYPAPNVTGIIERPHFRESLALSKRLRPIRRIAVLSCNDSTSMVALGFMKQEPLDVEVTEWLLVDNFDQWKAAVARLNNTVDALVIRSYQAVKMPGSRENVPPKEIAEWTARHATIPTIAFHDFEIEDGLLVGVVKSGQEYGRQAAEYARQILSGVSPAVLPVTRIKTGIGMLNRQTAARLGIVLPPDMASYARIVPES